MVSILRKSGVWIISSETRIGEESSAIHDRAIQTQYIVGNPLIAIQMAQHNLAAGLYAPLRVLDRQFLVGTPTG
jgi:hypothetical protein